MSSSECVKGKERNKDNNSEEDDNDDRFLAQSNAVNDAMQLTARLWARSDKSRTADSLEKTMTTFQSMPMPAMSGKRGRRKAEARKYQAAAY
eukprot:3513286-Karenia_brevis.AAC.1